MEYLLTKAHLSKPMFNGRGFLMDIKDNKERRGIVGALTNRTQMYLSRDAVEVIKKWITMWEAKLRGDEEFKVLPFTLSFNDITFILYDRQAYDYADIMDIHETQQAALIDEARKNFTTGFDSATWSTDSKSIMPYMAPSYNVPGRNMQFNFDLSGVTYDYRFANEPTPVPYVTRDLSMIRIAEALLNIADTNTYPSGGYKLDLKLGFGNLELAELSRNQIREIANRLVP